MAFPSTPVRGAIYWTSKRAAPLHLFFLVRGYREGLRGAPTHGYTCRSRAEMETGDELRGALHGQTRGVSRGTTDRQDLGDLERRTPPRSVGDGPGQAPGRLQDQAHIQKAGGE